MSFRLYFWGLSIITTLSLLAWLFVIFYIDPNESGLIGKLFFYASLILSLLGIFILLLSWLRQRFLGTDEAIETLGLSLRQGLLLTLTVSIIVFLQEKGYLVWWDGLLVVGGFFLIELYFLQKDE